MYSVLDKVTSRIITRVKLRVMIIWPTQSDQELGVVDNRVPNSYSRLQGPVDLFNSISNSHRDLIH